jgi:hypothetical protein
MSLRGCVFTDYRIYGKPEIQKCGSAERWGKTEALAKKAIAIEASPPTPHLH